MPWNGLTRNDAVGTLVEMQMLGRSKLAGRSQRSGYALVVVALVLAACGDAPLEALGNRSSDWINEPEVTTTASVTVTIPTSIDIVTLQWFNDDIVTENLSDPDLLVSEVFARREGDRFIQASRAEIAAALPGVQFPATVPQGAEWVSSQLVIENSGELSDDPTAAFGIWSAVPYSRSRSVAQMAVLRVSIDQETAVVVADSADELSCARFADDTTTGCEILDMDGRPVWALSSNQGLTLVWLDSMYRYELFGRSFVPVEALHDMAAAPVHLADLVPPVS